METAQHEGHPETGPLVGITVDTVTKPVHRGSQTIAQIKEWFGVSPEKELDQLIGGQLVGKADDDRVTLKGGEVFVSHERRGGAS